MIVEYHPATVSDLNAAVNHYNGEHAGVGDAFRAEVYAAIDQLLENPELYAETGGVRRALVKRFPYSVIYRLVARDRIRILLIRHHKRRSEYGAARR